MSVQPSKKRVRSKAVTSPLRKDTPLRLQKVLASAGIGSRRMCEELIVEGRVEVDGETVTELGTRVDPLKQEVRLDGEVLKSHRATYYLVHKPAGIVSTHRDPGGRQRVIDLVPAGDRLFTVGRLDMSSEGLILVTNDGELANRLAHPRYEVEKTYLVTVVGSPDREALAKLRSGIHLADGVVRASQIRIKKRMSKSTVLEIVLREGRNREIRRMAARIGHKVLSLRRIAMGPLRLGDLPKGAYRDLSSKEIKALRDFAENPAKRKASRPKSDRKDRSGDTGARQDDTGARKRGGKSTPSGKKSLGNKPPGKKLSGQKSSARKPLSKKSPSKKLSGQKSSARKPLSKKSPSKKLSGQKSSARKPLNKKSPGKKLSGQKSSARKPLSKKSPSKKLSGQKSSARKPLSKKSPSEKLSGQKSPGKKSRSPHVRGRQSDKRRTK